MRYIAGRRPAASALVAITVVLTLVVPPSVALAVTNSQIRAKQSEVTAASTKLQDLSDDLELKQTDLQAVEDALNATRDDIVATEAQLAAAQARLDESQARLADRAEVIYRDGPPTLLDVLVGVTDFADFVSRLDMLDRIETADAELVAQVSADRDRVDQAHSALVNREGEQVALRSEAIVREQEVQAAVDRQKSFIASLNAQLKQLVKAEQQRQERLAAEAARRAAAAAASHTDPRPSDVGDLGTSHPQVVAIAARYLGVPYAWGGTTPAGFDCSGFVQYVYAQIGIELPRTSRMQFTIGKFIPRSQLDMLEAGDLVFFGYGGDANQIHHVGLYVGNGVFIEAPSTGDHVKYSSLTDRITTRGDYVGAVRP